MHVSFLLLCLAVGAWVKCAAGNEWCYTDCEHTPAHWGNISGSFCEGNRQSPINIVTSNVETDHDLLDFNFVNFTSRNVFKSIINNGHTVKCILAENEVEVSGGGLNGTYSTIQFHFHWGDKEHHPGSEHMIDGHRYPMEMHIVSLKKGLTVEQATEDSAGIAVLGFFIDVTEDGIISEPWKRLATYLTDNTGTEVAMNASISIDDLIGNINLTKFYRYMGSLTTPNCNEAVVWTVFHEPININKDLIQQFPEKTGLTNVYRPPQELNDRQVYASPATPLPPSHSWCYDDHCAYSPANWHLLPQSQCDKQHQSPINIDTNNVVMDEHLDAFTFVKFDDKHAISRITNTGHTVKCILKEGVVEISGGGLEHMYSTLQFHFHWGSTSDDPEGSEHMVDSHRYPMEMHIVNKRKDLTLDEAVKQPDGLAVLGFFIEAADMTKSTSGSESPETNPTSNPTSDAWEKLIGYLSSIQNISSEVEVTAEVSIDDLIGDVDRAAYYRYKGSLTTPSCNEAVVWTVFKESIKMDKKLMMMFPTQTGYHDVFRPAQSVNGRTIYTSSASSPPAPIRLLLLLGFLCAFLTQLHL